MPGSHSIVGFAALPVNSWSVNPWGLHPLPKTTDRGSPHALRPKVWWKAKSVGMPISVDWALALC